MAIYYPRKQTIFIFLISIVTVGAVAYYVLPGESTSVVSQNSIKTDPAPTDNAPLVASDNWKDQFISTTTKKMSSASQSADPDANLTLTDRMGRDFFTQYIELQQANLTQDPDTLSNVANNIVSNSLNAEAPKQYSVADITVANTDDQTTLSAWQANVLRILSLYNAPDSEAVIAKEYLDTSDPTILVKIDPIVTMYGKMIPQLLSTPTPHSAEADMVNLVNALSTLKFAAISFRQMAKDPMLGMIGIKSFGDGAEGIDSAFVAIREHLAGHGLAFNVNPQVIRTVFEDQK